MTEYGEDSDLDHRDHESVRKDESRDASEAPQLGVAETKPALGSGGTDDEGWDAPPPENTAVEGTDRSSRSDRTESPRVAKEPQELWRRGDANVNGEVTLDARPEALPSAPPEIQRGLTQGPDGDLSVATTARDYVLPAGNDAGWSEAARSQQIDDSRRAVEEAIEDWNVEHGKPPEGSDADFREAALANFELDDLSVAQAQELGARLADDFDPKDWAAETLDERRETAEQVGRACTEQLNLPETTIESRDMPENSLGASNAEIVLYNESLLYEADPGQLLETVAHEVRHQWQSSVLNGRKDHPVGDSGLYKIVFGEFSYKSDQNHVWNYVDNYQELDAESFARAVSAAYNEAVKSRQR